PCTPLAELETLGNCPGSSRNPNPYRANRISFRPTSWSGNTGSCYGIICFHSFFCTSRHGEYRLFTNGPILFKQCGVDLQKHLFQGIGISHYPAFKRYATTRNLCQHLSNLPARTAFRRTYLCLIRLQECQ